VTYDGDVVWSYVNPVAASGVLSSTDSIPMAGGGAFQGNLVFRANKYPSDFLGFAGHDLSSGVQIEFNPIMADCVLGVEDFDEDAFLIYPNPTLGNITVEGLSGAFLQMFDMSGRLIYSRQVYSDNERIELGSFVKGLYFIQFELDGQRISSKLIID
jgi:hypothetical protein